MTELKTTEPAVSIVIPLYNEEKTIAETLRQVDKLKAVMPSMEVIVVDDGSTDRSADEISRFPFVDLIAHGENRGKGTALSTGFKVASGDVIVIQDADLEYPASNIPRLVEPILKGKADVVIGSRIRGVYEGMSLSHFVGNMILSLTVRLLYHVPITDVMTGHKCFRREVIKSISLTEDGFGIEVELMCKILENGWRFLEVPIRYSKRIYGVPKIRYSDGLNSSLKILRMRLKSPQKIDENDKKNH